MKKPLTLEDVPAALGFEGVGPDEPVAYTPDEEWAKLTPDPDIARFELPLTDDKGESS